MFSQGHLSIVIPCMQVCDMIEYPQSRIDVPADANRLAIPFNVSHVLFECMII